MTVSNLSRRPIRIGTRGSALALAQASEVRARLMATHDLGEDAFEIAVISTSGDRILDRPLSEVGGKGLFTKEIEEALFDGRIDLAVHSSKDMASALPGGLRLSTFLEREDVRDAFIGRTARTIAELPEGAVVGSASLRRQALLKRMRPDLKLVILRGNVQTRLAKLANGDVDATLLALAGLNRLGLGACATEILSETAFPPAPGQGAICIETRVGDGGTEALLAAIDHGPTHLALRAERAFLAELDGSCRTPIAAHARIEGDAVHLSGMILSPDGTQAHSGSREGTAADGESLGRSLARVLLEEAGPAFFEGWAR
jgi:hydroxymethylbilane synthase